jgi:uncharacterized membrane protein
MSKLARVVWVTLVLSTCLLSSSAQIQPCPQGTLANVLGTSCSVGPVVLTFQNFDGRSIEGNVLINGDGFIRPAEIGFVPVQSGNQAGFQLIANFADGPGPDASFLGFHQLLLGYGPQAAPNFEILGEDLTIDASAQASTQGTPSVRVSDGQDYPIIDFFSIQAGISSQNGILTPVLHNHVNYLVPAFASDITTLVTFNTNLTTIASGTSSAALRSATFLYTMGPVVPAPPLAPLTYTNVDLPGMPTTEVFNINDIGQQVGEFQDALGIQHGYVTDERGVLTAIDFPGATATAAEGINNHGDIVGIYFDGAGVIHGFLQQNGVLTSIDFPGAILTFPIEINDGGQIVGEYRSADRGIHGFLLDNGQFSTIDHGPTAGRTALSFASGINNRGELVGPFFDPRTFRGFLDSKTGSQQLDIPGQGDTEPDAINNPGDIVGTYDDINFLTHGFLRANGSYQTVDFPGGNTTLPFGINSQQQIVGVYFDDAGNPHSFLAVPGNDNGANAHSNISAGRRPANVPACGSGGWRQRLQQGNSGSACDESQ